MFYYQFVIDTCIIKIRTTLFAKLLLLFLLKIVLPLILSADPKGFFCAPFSAQKQHT